jgi:hypothetical protein
VVEEGPPNAQRSGKLGSRGPNSAIVVMAGYTSWYSAVHVITAEIWYRKTAVSPVIWEGPVNPRPGRHCNCNYSKHPAQQKSNSAVRWYSGKLGRGLGLVQNVRSLGLAAASASSETHDMCHAQNDTTLHCSAAMTAARAAGGRSRTRDLGLRIQGPGLTTAAPRDHTR